MDPAFGVEELSAGPAVDFQLRASGFYSRLTRRRFNTLATFSDPQLRGHFRSDGQFADYYADLAQALSDASFERNRPLSADVEEFVFDGPGHATVRLRLVGENAKPLRWWSTAVEREDRWERVDGEWWIVPGKL